MKLLIVEDNAAMRSLIRAIVGDLAEAVVECADGSEVFAAYAAAQFNHADWVLMDVRMVTLDGLAATRALTAQWPDARVVIVTGFNDAKLRAAANAAGACGYVLKEDLLALRQLLSSPAKAPISEPA
jgi:CheY-like chemotaxis protein